MKIAFSKESVLSVVQKLQGFIPINPPLPLLSNVCIEATQEGVSFSISDLNITVKGSLKAKVEEEGSLLLPAKQFFALCKEFISPEFTLSSSSTYLTMIKSGGSQFRLAGASSEGFPKLPMQTLPIVFSCPSISLKEMLMKTAFAAGKDEARPIFNSLLLQKQGSTTTITGTDGKRLARTSSHTSSFEGWEGSLVLPLRTVQEMIQLLDNKDEQVSLSLHEDKLFLQMGSFFLQSRLLVGDYPDVSKIIPSKTGSSIRLHREELTSLLRQIALFTTTTSHCVRFAFSPGELQLSVANAEAGEGTVSMPVNFQGDPLQIGFNPHFFLDALRHVKEETVDLEVKDSYSPGLITVEASDKPSSLFVLMPMRLDT
ncbi:MAG: DNA polymerase III subunit beta [Chlamydiae bacterium]|nr:DNA polymerase III subunit beta [Chlamydiota bacterium]